jgi:ligand-binding SRPBCC domain-containing protein
MFSFAIASWLAAPRDAVWAHATSMRGVNQELWPLAQMTHPRDVTSIGAVGDAPVLGQRLFRSWILAFGVLPIDYDDLTLVELEPGRRFLEHSSMATQREWIHERVLHEAEGGTILTDAVSFVPRIAWLGPLFQSVFVLAFRLRHRNLRRRFSGRAAPPNG